MIQLNKISRHQEIEMERDYIEEIGHCEHCGIEDDTLIVHHCKSKLKYPQLRHNKKYWKVLCNIDHDITERGGKDRFNKKWSAKEFDDYLLTI